MSFCVHVYVCLHKSFYVCVCAYICMRMSMRTFLCPCMTVYYVSLFAYVFLCLCLRLSVSSCGVFLLLHQRKHLNGYFASGQAEAVRFWSSINGGGGRFLFFEVMGIPLLGNSLSRIMQRRRLLLWSALLISPSTFQEGSRLVLGHPRTDCTAWKNGNLNLLHVRPGKMEI